MTKVVILPANNDLNRGDQALIWETINVARRSGLDGEFFMLAENESLTKQSQAEGIKIITPLLKHPRRKFKSTDNTNYGLKLLFKWGSVAIIDTIFSLLLLSKVTRKIMVSLLNEADKKAYMTIKDCDVCFVKGGGFIHSTGKMTDPYTVYYLLYHVILAQSFSKPVYVMPNSFGPFKGIGVEWLVRRVMNKCKIVAVRESISKEMVEKIGVKTILMPDLGFALSKSSNQFPEIEKIKDCNPEKKLVAITARPYRFPNSNNPEEKYKEYIDNMVLFSKWLFENGCLPVFVDHTLSNTTHERDFSCIQEIVSKLKDREYLIISNEDYNCKDLKAIYGEFDYVIGTRFHSVIFALSENIPSLAITYGGNKGQGIMRDLGLSEYAIPMSELKADRAIQSFKRLVQNEEQVRNVLKRNKEYVEQKHTDLVNIIKETL